MFSQSFQVENTSLDALVAAILVGQSSCLILLLVVDSGCASLFAIVEWQGPKVSDRSRVCRRCAKAVQSSCEMAEINLTSPQQSRRQARLQAPHQSLWSSTKDVTRC